MQHIIKWFKKAESDLKVVRHMLEIDDPPTDAICFHCQQAIEKYFKAFLTFKNIRVRKTHDLETLLDLCIEQDNEFENINREKLSGLNFFAVEIRYPDDFYMPAISETVAYFEIAKTIKTFIIQKLNIKESDIK